MNPQETQASNPQGQMSHDELSAALAHATALQEQMLPQGQPEQNTSQETPQEETQETSQEKPKEEKSEEKSFGELNGKIDTLTKLVGELLTKEKNEN